MEVIHGKYCGVKDVEVGMACKIREGGACESNGLVYRNPQGGSNTCCEHKKAKSIKDVLKVKVGCNLETILSGNSGLTLRVRTLVEVIASKGVERRNQ